MRSGFCSIVGRPNVGKSTLLNALVGQKIAITTSVPQTTRHAIRGIIHRDDVQVVFVDTPGMHKPKTLLGSRLNEVATEHLRGMDVVVLVVDASAEIGRGDRFVAGLLENVPTPVFAVANKIDRITPAQQLPQLAALSELGEFDEIVPVSAATGDGVERLERLIAARMPEGPPYFPEGQVSDQSTEQLVSEIIREKAITRMREEVPHSVAVAIEEMGPGESEGVIAIYAWLYVERESQKGIVIGHGGQVLREIGAAARKELELVLASRVYLDLRVKLLKEWQRDAKALQRLGY